MFLYHLEYYTCTDAPCKNGATCLSNDNAGGIKCICTAAWKGLYCESKCEHTASNCPDSAGRLPNVDRIYRVSRIRVTYPDCIPNMSYEPEHLGKGYIFRNNMIKAKRKFSYSAISCRQRCSKLFTVFFHGRLIYQTPTQLLLVASSHPAINVRTHICTSANVNVVIHAAV